MHRLSRKTDHILGVLYNKPSRADFSDIHLLPSCLPGLSLEEISLRTSYLGRTFRSPFYINALTGGTLLSFKINAALARVAALLELPMAVGSQKIALETKSFKVKRSFTIARQLNPKGEIWANLGSYADGAMARHAVEMLHANALQIHLNAAQELAMPEGERSFKGVLERIERIAKNLPVPLIAKEVGFGVAFEEARLLQKAQVAAIDISGRGGTDFITLENMRRGVKHKTALCGWGLPTAISLLEVLAATDGKPDVLASGGLYHPLDAAKALALGAKAVGVAALPLYLLLKKDEEAVLKSFKHLESALKKIMLLTGSKTIEDLQKRPLTITGLSRQWLESRGLYPAVLKNLRPAT